MSNGSAVASLVLGIISILIFLTGPIGLIMGIVGLVLARKGRINDAASGVAKAGFVTSLIGTILCAIFTVIIIVTVVMFGAAFTIGLDALAGLDPSTLERAAQQAADTLVN